MSGACDVCDVLLDCILQFPAPVCCRYGSVIFFNLRQRSRAAWLDKLITVLFCSSRVDSLHPAAPVFRRYGSVIFFNLRQRSRAAWLDKLITVLFCSSRVDSLHPAAPVFRRYGSVIFFNLRQRSRDAWLDKLTPHIKVPEHYRSNGSSSSSNGGIGPQRRTDGEPVMHLKVVGFAEIVVAGCTAQVHRVRFTLCVAVLL
jgi:hypothetical protein